MVSMIIKKRRKKKTQIIRKSERHHTRPKYLNDYILLAEELSEEMLLFLDNEPQNFDEAKDSREWRRACEETLHREEQYVGLS